MPNPNPQTEIGSHHGKTAGASQVSWRLFTVGVIMTKAPYVLWMEVLRSF
jgi:hypothetical protein